MKYWNFVYLCGKLNKMNAKEKSVELLDKYRTYIRIADRYEHNLPSDEIHIAKKCAIIAVDEIINSSPSLPILSDNGTFGGDIEESKVFWQDVKKELELLK